MIELMLEDKREQLGKICESYIVKQLDLSGSGLGKDFDPDNSDVDFMVAFAPRSPARLFDRYFGLKEELEMLLGHQVDLVMEGAIARNPYFARSINENRTTVYAA